MESLFEWLYDHYAEPQLQTPPVFQKEQLQPLLQSAPKAEGLHLADQ